jgi:hypothetical protein
MKIIREREIKIVEHSTERQMSFEYDIFENGRLLFSWNNPKMPVEFITKALFNPLPKQSKESLT